MKAPNTLKEATAQTSTERGGERDHALDMVKGFLVLAMVVYHTATTFLPDGALQHQIYHSLHIVSGSWIFISGFIIIMHYREKFGRNPTGISRRLVVRGVKLLLLVSVLNFVITLLMRYDTLDSMLIPQALWNIYVIGDGQASFEILIGIGYLLILGPLFLLHRIIGPLLALILVAAGMVYQFVGTTQLPSNAWMLVCGLSGLLAGVAAARGRLAALVFHPIAGRAALILAAVATVVYLGPLTTHWSLRTMLFAYIPGIVVSLLFLYILATRLRWEGASEQVFSLMAHYSLSCYVGQMFIIMALHRIVGGHPILASYPVALILVVIFMLLGILFLDKVRQYYVRRSDVSILSR